MNLEWVQWGNVPAWIGAGSSIYTARTFKRQDAEQKAENMRRRQRQARQVHVIAPRWGGQDVVARMDDTGDLLEDPYEVHLLRLGVHNLSADPIRQARVHYVTPRLYLLGGHECSTAAASIGPDNRHPWSEHLRPGSVMAAANSPSDPDDSPTWNAFEYWNLQRHGLGKLPDVWVTFQDSDGVCWKRLVNGHLEELEELPT